MMIKMAITWWKFGILVPVLPDNKLQKLQTFTTNRPFFENIYQLLIHKYKSIKYMYFLVIFITLISLFRCTHI